MKKQQRSLKLQSIKNTACEDVCCVIPKRTKKTPTLSLFVPNNKTNGEQYCPSMDDMTTKTFRAGSASTQTRTLGISESDVTASFCPSNTNTKYVNTGQDNADNKPILSDNVSTTRSLKQIISISSNNKQPKVHDNSANGGQLVPKIDIMEGQNNQHNFRRVNDNNNNNNNKDDDHYSQSSSSAKKESNFNVCVRCHKYIMDEREIPEILNGMVFHKKCFDYGKCAQCHKRIILREVPKRLSTCSHTFLFHESCFGHSIIMNNQKVPLNQKKESTDSRSSRGAIILRDDSSLSSITVRKIDEKITPQCARCHKMIFGVPENVTILGHVLQFHKKCSFHGQCARCQENIPLGEVPQTLTVGGGGDSGNDQQDLLFHEECFTRGECARCHKSILLNQSAETFHKGATQDELIFHKECFIYGRCGLCRERLLLDEKPKKGEVVFHKECFDLRVNAP